MLPSAFREPADYVVTVAGLDYTPADPSSARAIKLGRRDLTGDGVWWIDYEAGVRKLGIYPTAATGSSITMLAVVTPDILSDPTDEPPVPWDFRKAIVHYCRAIALGFSEDDPEGQEVGFGEFERQVVRLRQLVVEIEAGDGPIQVMVSGIHW